MIQISFLHSSLLFFTATTLLPLIVWLIAKRKPPKVVIPSLRFVKQSQEEQKKRSQLKNILLLIIRMLIILLITLAIARPQVYSSRLKDSSKHPPTAIGIVLDNSFSMDYFHEGKSNLERAKEAIGKINGLCKSGDKVLLISLDESWNMLHSQVFAGKLPQDLISQIQITHNPISISNALKQAKDKLALSGLPNRELYLLTDRQATDYPKSFEMDVHLIPLELDKANENISISELKPRSQLVDKTRRQSLDFSIINHGSEDVKDLLIRAILKDQRVSEKFIDLPAGQQRQESITIELMEDGWQTGYVEIVEERLLHDNRSYFAFPHSLSPKLAVVSTQNVLPFYLDSALSVFAGGTGRYKLIHPDALRLADAEVYSHFVFYDLGSSAAKIQDFFTALKGQNQGALVILNEHMSASVRNMWESIFSCKISAFHTGYKDLSSFNSHHYVSSLIGNKDLANRKSSHFFPLKANQAVALVSSGSEALVLSKDKNVLFSFDPAKQMNNLFLGPIFPLLSYRALEYSSQSSAEGNKLKIGDLIEGEELTLPDGSKIKSGNRSHRINSPGIYFSSQGASTNAYAVDADAIESRNDKQDFSKLKYIKTMKKDWTKQIFLSRLGHDIWKYLLMAALILFLIEIIIIKSSEFKAADQQGQ
ncbi:MAG TPA: BatA domain-containing protein [Candidatus Cloacimonadota bacterium]|nr:BatA domain-containing protein [Candidatus Cloacimonadota bacterium]